MIGFRGTRVRITHPTDHDQELVVNTSDARAATVGAIPSAIDTVTIPWERPSARDHSSPGQASMTLILSTARHEVVRWDSAVTITTHPAWAAGSGYWSYGDEVTVWAGWIDQITVTQRRIRHPDTGAWVVTWEHAVTMYDMVGRASGTKIGDQPWPPEGPLERLDRIEAVAPYQVLDPDPLPGNWGSNYLAPRDVDNIELLEPIQSVAGSLLRTVHPTPDGLRLFALPGNELGAMWGSPSDTRIPIVDIRASVLSQAARHLDRSGRVTQVAIGYTWQDTDTGGNPVGDPEQRTRVVADRTATATAEARIETEHLVYPGENDNPLDVLEGWAESLLEFTRDPVAVLEPVAVLLDLLTFDDLALVAALVSMGGRSAALVRIVDGPQDIPVWQHVTGGTLELHGAKARLTLTLTPTLMAGQRALVWHDLDSNATINPLVWARAPYGLRWGDLTVSTLPPKD